MKLSEEQIKEIAGELDIGMICYVHKKTGEVKSIIDFDDVYADTELWEEEMKEIEKNRDQYIKIEKMSSSDSFRVMEAFTDEVADQRIKDRLVYALERNKPFRNFKYEVDYDEEVRQQWFAFKARKYQEWVKDYFEWLSEEEE